MNVHEIFKLITVGCTFDNKKFNSTTFKPVPIKDDPYKIEIKDEIEESTDTVDEDLNDGSVDEQPMSLIDGIVAAPSKKRKKKKVMTEEKLIGLEIERINQIRNRNHINVTGKNPPAPITTLAQLQSECHIPVQFVDKFIGCGFTAPTPIQMQAIPIMISGHSIMACAPTGSGKTAAFLLPIMKSLRKPKTKGFRALILCPTRELARQTQREALLLCDDIGIQVHCLNKLHRAEERYGPTSNKKFDILVTTPKRVCYLLSQHPPILDLSNIRWLILDEADKLFEDGKNSFRDQFNQIYDACTHSDKKVGLFSATWTTPVAKWGRQKCKGMLTVSVGQRNSATDLVDQELLFVGSEAGKLIAIRDLIRTGLKPPVLIFVESKDRAQQLYNELMYDGVNIDVIHADRTQQERDNVVTAFREGTVWVLICTELIGRGIDFKGVNLVINYDFPPSAIAYIHRIGRTGRAGRRGRAITYFTQSDAPNLRSIAIVMKNSGCPVPEYMLAMKRQSKRERRKVERTAVKRDDIRTMSTLLKKRKPVKKKQGTVGGKFVMIKPENGNSINKESGKRKLDSSGSGIKFKKRKKKSGIDH